MSQMEENIFDVRLTKIEQARELDQRRVDGRYEQRLARLFHSSEWTQQRIADKVGKERSFISRVLLFGRFLHFVSSGHKVKIPANLTERAFRKYWEATEKYPKEAKRFAEVLKLMSSECLVELPDEAKNTREKLVAAGKQFRTKAELAELVGYDVLKLQNTLSSLNSDQRYEVVHNNGSPRHRKYKVLKAGRRVPLEKIMEHIEPLLSELEEQGKCESSAHYSPRLILIAVTKLRKLLDDFSK